jgi:hypothetical protein
LQCRRKRRRIGRDFQRTARRRLLYLPVRLPAYLALFYCGRYRAVEQILREQFEERDVW